MALHNTSGQSRISGRGPDAPLWFRYDPRRRRPLPRTSWSRRREDTESPSPRILNGRARVGGLRGSDSSQNHLKPGLLEDGRDEASCLLMPVVSAESGGLKITRLELKDSGATGDSISNPTRPTILVGPNAAGKTNIIEAVQLVTAADSSEDHNGPISFRWGESQASVSPHGTR